MFERFGSPCVIAAASVIVLAATPAAAQGTPEPAPPPPGTTAQPPPASGSAGGSVSTGTGLSLGASGDAPPVLPPTTTTVTETKDEKWEAPIAGYNGVFYIRSKDDVFQTWFNGRLQFDFTHTMAAGAYDANLLSGFLVRRARFENAGCWGDFCYSIQPEYGPTSVTAPNQAPAPRTSAILATAFINYKIHPVFQIMAGNVQTPFGMEARTTTKYKDFLEDGISTRFAVPAGTEQGITFWGATEKNVFNYELGVFSGDSGNRPNADNRFDFMGRVFVRPMANQKSAVSNLQIGISGKYGTRDANKVNYDMHSITTANGYGLWGPTYTVAPVPAGLTTGVTRILPAGAQSGFAAELRVPVENFDLTGEFYLLNYGTREMYDNRIGTAIGNGNFNHERFGKLSGISYYAQASYWIGKRDITGEPGFFRISRLAFKKPEAKPAGAAPAKPKGPDTAWRIRVRYDNVTAEYKGADESGTVAQRNVGGQPITWYDGDIKIHALQAGLDYFYTKHFGFRLNYGLYYTPDSAPATPQAGSIAPVATEANRAAAPGNRLAAGLNDDARRGAHSIHELILRAQVAF